MANYLYNGVELPDIDEVWNNKKVIPFAAIFWEEIEKRYELMTLFTDQMVATADHIVAVKDVKRHEYLLSGSSWEYDGLYNTHAGDNMTYHPNQPLIWSSFDILNEEGTVFLAASSPVPVLSIDHTAMVQGWIVGKRLAAMRGKIPVDITDAVLENDELYIFNAHAQITDVELEVF